MNYYDDVYAILKVIRRAGKKMFDKVLGSPTTNGQPDQMMIHVVHREECVLINNGNPERAMRCVIPVTQLHALCSGEGGPSTGVHVQTHIPSLSLF
jgi:hypothetical protein